MSATSSLLSPKVSWNLFNRFRADSVTGYFWTDSTNACLYLWRLSWRNSTSLVCLNLSWYFTSNRLRIGCSIWTMSSLLRSKVFRQLSKSWRVCSFRGNSPWIISRKACLYSFRFCWYSFCCISSSACCCCLTSFCCFSSSKYFASANS